MNEAPSYLSAETWQQVQELLAEALDRPADERTAYLRRACGHDVALYREVASLLAAYTAAGGFLDALDPAGAAALLADADADAEVGRAVGPYRIVRPLGRGGMGVVYLAEDTRLNRRVALKFLPPHLAADAGAVQRLFAEARAAAALDHPHVAVVHEVGETEPDLEQAGRPFIAMAYYDGETLREKIRRGPLPVAEAQTLARQIAEGLRAAHRQGIVHRDVKPSNILVTPDGLAKIVDFGIARLIGAALTQPGTTPGTVAYMSPEQTRGEPVDGRSDLWSLGVVLYEMLTGRRPFRGDHHQTLIHAIRHDPPEPAERLRPETPAPLARAVQRCLEKNPARRYPDADALLADLHHAASGRPSGGRARRLAGRVAAVVLTAALLGALYLGLKGSEPAPPAEASRLAVLPLDNISPDPKDAYFAAGMTEELVSRLSRLSGLRVIGRTSVQRYADTDEGIAEIGQALDVSAVLDGSVRKAGDHMRLSVQLIDATTEVPLWSEDYDAEAADVLAVQRAIAEQVAEALNVQMQAGEQRRLAQQGTDLHRAYELYLKGRYFVNTWDEARVIEGRDALQQAADLDPTFAEAWAALADAYKILDYLGVVAPEAAGPRIRAAAERALALDPELAAAHAALATVLIDFYHDWETAGHHHRRSVELDPGSGASLVWYAEYLRDQGRFDEALAMIEKAQAADPLSPWYLMVEGIILDFAHRPEEALAQYEHVLDLHPNYQIVHFYIGLANAQLERYDVVLSQMDTVDPDRTFPDALGLRAFALAARGQTAEARAVLDEMEVLSEERYVAPFLQALAYMELGQTDHALDLFAASIEERSWFTRIYKVAPLLDPIRSHPRFQALLEQIGLAD